MSLTRRGFQARAAASALVLPLAASSGPARAQGQPSVMKIGLATINDAQHEWCKRFVAMVEKDTNGRIKGEIYPASQLGPIPREVEGTQFGAIQLYVGPPEFLVGVDARFEVMSTPGVVKDMAHGIRVTGDAELQKMMFSFGANKGIHGVGLWVSQPSSIVSREPIRHLADIKGKKLRVLAADMQQEMVKRLGASPIAMTLGDVLPAIQQGAIDGAVLALTVDQTMRYYDAAKYITQTGQPFIFSMAFVSNKWYETLSKEFQEIINKNALTAAGEANTWQADFYAKGAKLWTQSGGEIIDLPPAEEAELVKIAQGVGPDIVSRKPVLRDAYDMFVAAAKRTA